MSNSEIKVIHQEITPMRQSLETSCVPTSVSMAFSGFGVNISEHELIDKYFPNAKNPIIDPETGEFNEKTGAANSEIVRGMVHAVKDLDLQNDLQVDVFDPYLYEYTNSKEMSFIVGVTPGEIKRCGKRFKDGPLREFYDTLAEMRALGDIGVYTGNKRLLQINQRELFGYMSPEIREGFFEELRDFIRKGHIVGPHGGGTMHCRVLDGISTEWIPRGEIEEESFTLVDPARDEQYPAFASHLVWLSSSDLRGDTFDYLFRLSLNETQPTITSNGFKDFLNNLRRLIP